jgi:hypothetical protein
MNKFRLAIKLLVIATFMLAFASLTQAQATRTWVSGVGDDVNPCSRTAPCKTWAGAISKTAACGEIDALDPGGFGAVTITKSMILDGTGTFASTLASGTNGITINVAATDFVTIRGISINGSGTSCSFGVNGINVVNIGPKDVNIEDCVISHFTNGVSVNVTSTTELNIRNTVIRDNSGDGVAVNTSAGAVNGSFVNSSFNGNSNGVHAKINARLSADQCNFARNSNNGVLADGGTGVANITNSGIFNNGSNGVNGGSGGVVRINNCDIFNNVGSGALVTGGGEVDSWGNNRIFGNGTDGCVSCLPKGTA